jgi:hypothetical protein
MWNVSGDSLQLGGIVHPTPSVKPQHVKTILSSLNPAFAWTVDKGVDN